MRCFKEFMELRGLKIKIGDRALIGLGAVVTKSIPGGEVWAGSPAKFIKKVS